MWHMKSWGTSFQSYAVVPDYWLDGFTSQHSVLIHYNYFIKNQILLLAPENLIQEAAIDRLCVYQAILHLSGYSWSVNTRDAQIHWVLLSAQWTVHDIFLWRWSAIFLNFFSWVLSFKELGAVTMFQNSILFQIRKKSLKNRSMKLPTFHSAITFL